MGSDSCKREMCRFLLLLVFLFVCVCICVCVFVCEMEENFLSIEAGSLRTVGNRVKNTFGEFPLWLSKLQT